MGADSGEVSFSLIGASGFLSQSWEERGDGVSFPFFTFVNIQSIIFILFLLMFFSEISQCFEGDSKQTEKQKC